jgi:hypothetical protein
MSPERQRVVIAELCGHKDIAIRIIAEGTGLDTPMICSGVVGLGGYSLPDYLNDLNAMRDAEVCLFKGSDLWQKFAFALIDASGGSGMSELDGLCCMIQATAAQRAESFLRTLNKWEECE